MPRLSDESFRVRVPDPLKLEWEKMLGEHNVTTQRALLAMMEWVVGEDPLTRAMIFKLVPRSERAELSRIVLGRLAAPAKGPARKRVG